jgi:hypothetical protein
MTTNDPDFERDLRAALEREAPPSHPALHDRVVAEVAATAQRSRRAPWSQWVAIAGVAAVAMVIGILIGSSRVGVGSGGVGSGGPNATPLGSSSVSPSVAPPDWTEASSYSFVFASTCGERNLLGTFKVTVEGGAAVAYRPLDEQASRFPGSFHDMPTLASLMALVEEARTYQSLDPTGRSPAAEPSGIPGPSPQEAIVTLETDPVDGHPTYIHIDWVPNAIDEEECYRIEEYSPAVPVSPSPGSSEQPIAWTEPSAYTYVFDSQCGLRVLNGRFGVSVQDGRVVAYHALATGESPPQLAGEIPTLGDLVHRVELARGDGEAVIRAYEVDPEDGHPTRIDIDWLPNAVDDEECYVIESYTPEG